MNRRSTTTKACFGGKRLTSHATFIDKMMNAKNHGARGVILVNDMPAHAGSEDKLEKFGVDGRPARRRNILRSDEGADRRSVAARRRPGPAPNRQGDRQRFKAAIVRLCQKCKWTCPWI